jgi:DNA-binding transcriptional regulator GbsR (MarR family)
MQDIENRQHFIQDIARILVPSGVPETAARLYGYLLLSESPVSLDEMVAELQVSKSTASVAARQLEMYTLARRQSQRGTRGILYEASDDFDGILKAQMRYMGQLTELLRQGARKTRNKATRNRLGVMADFYLLNRNALELALREWATRK